MQFAMVSYPQPASSGQNWELGPQFWSELGTQFWSELGPQFWSELKAHSGQNWEPSSSQNRGPILGRTGNPVLVRTGSRVLVRAGQNLDPSSGQPSSGQNWDPQFRLVRTEGTALVSQLIFQLFFCSCSACWSKAVENAGRSISVRFACRSIERHAFSAGFACRSERHAKTVENARTSIERHAFVFKCFCWWFYRATCCVCACRCIERAPCKTS